MKNPLINLYSCDDKTRTVKRKVIQLGEDTHVVTLPAKWARTYGITKGSELEVSEDGNRITLATNAARAINKTTADLRHATEQTLRWTLSSLHKQGFDEIELTLATAEQSTVVEEMLRDLFIGFAVVHKTTHSITLRAISAELDDQLDTILRRAFLITLQHAEGLHDALKHSKTEELTPLLSLEKQNNQLTNFCQRILNKKGHKNPLKTNFLYVITWNLEKISDEYKYLTEHFLNANADKKTLDLLLKTNTLLRGYYELFYAFDAKKLATLSDEYKTLEREIKKEITTDPLALAHLLAIISKTADFSASTYALHD